LLKSRGNVPTHFQFVFPKRRSTCGF
jgi:hypothetical protein